MVVKGFTQNYGIDFDETFAPTLKMSTFWMIVLQSVTFGLSLVHMDVVTALLNRLLNEEICLHTLKYMQTAANFGSVFKLNKAHMVWNRLLDTSFYVFICSFSSWVSGSRRWFLVYTKGYQIWDYFFGYLCWWMICWLTLT